MPSGKKITKAKVLEVKDFLTNCPGAATHFVANKCCVSETTVRGIAKGAYDWMLEPEPTTEEKPAQYSLDIMFGGDVLEKLDEISSMLKEIIETRKDVVL